VILPLQPAQIKKEKAILKSNPAGIITARHPESHSYIAYLLATQ